ncbi:NAD(P)-dependent dehydrogenase (short-subunit alcohol dehydrogenase family) [Paenibacillus sp. DS2015]
MSFTRSLSLQLVDRGIRVNAVAPGPIWTPMKRAGQPFELAPSYIYLASDDSSFMTGQVLHVNGGIMTET